MNMAVDQARAHDLAPGIDHDFGVFVAGPKWQDPAPADPQIAELIDLLRGVDDPPAADLNGSHGFFPHPHLVRATLFACSWPFSSA